MAEIFPNFKKTLSPQNRRCSTDLEDKHGKKKSRYITIKFRSSAGEKNLKTNKRKKKRHITHNETEINNDRNERKLAGQKTMKYFLNLKKGYKCTTVYFTKYFQIIGKIKTF